MDVEELAQVLHEAGREAVEKRLLVRTDVPVHPFVEWPELTEEAREGRRVQARYLLARFNIAEKAADQPSIAPSPTVGRIVHYVLDNGEHRAAIVAKAPGTLIQSTERGPKPSGVEVPGVVDLTVFYVQGDFAHSSHSRIPESPSLSGIQYDAKGCPGTWHWPEREE